MANAAPSRAAVMLLLRYPTTRTANAKPTAAPIHAPRVPDSTSNPVPTTEADSVKGRNLRSSAPPTETGSAMTTNAASTAGFPNELWSRVPNVWSISTSGRPASSSKPMSPAPSNATENPTTRAVSIEDRSDRSKRDNPTKKATANTTQAAQPICLPAVPSTAITGARPNRAARSTRPRNATIPTRTHGFVGTATPDRHNTHNAASRKDRTRAYLSSKND